jgi:hypothetical protein
VKAAADFAEAKLVFCVTEDALGRDVVLPAIPGSGAVDPAGVVINGRRIAGSTPLRRDTRGRSLPGGPLYFGKR